MTTSIPAATLTIEERYPRAVPAREIENQVRIPKGAMPIAVRSLAPGERFVYANHPQRLARLEVIDCGAAIVATDQGERDVLALATPVYRVECPRWRYELGDRPGTYDIGEVEADTAREAERAAVSERGPSARSETRSRLVVYPMTPTLDAAVAELVAEGFDSIAEAERWFATEATGARHPCHAGHATCATTAGGTCAGAVWAALSAIGDERDSLRARESQVVGHIVAGSEAAGSELAVARHTWRSTMLQMIAQVPFRDSNERAAAEEMATEHAWEPLARLLDTLEYDNPSRFDWDPYLRETERDQIVTAAYEHALAHPHATVRSFRRSA